MIDAAATQEPQPIADFAAKLREEFGEPAPAAEAAPRPPWWTDQRALLADVGLDPRRYGHCRPEVGFSDGPSERRFQVFLANLPAHIREGRWLYLLGGIGTRKTGSMARLAMALQYSDLPLQPGQLHPGLVRYYFAPEVAEDFEALGIGQRTGTMHVLLGARVVMLDDIHRWLEIGGYVRESILAGWDTYTELRDGYGVTAVSANLTVAALEQTPQFRSGLDRARGRGEIIELRGGSARGAGEDGAA